MPETPIPTPQYPYIRAWGAMMGSSDAYIEREVFTARESGAPATAIFARFDGTKFTGEWATFEDVNPEGSIRSWILSHFRTMGWEVTPHA
jgi:hypothetical protein